VLAGCTGAPDVPVRVPDSPAAGCARLHDALPKTLGGLDRAGTTPPSIRTAAWGDPPVVLRCGVGRPAGLTATSQVIEVDGVEWFLTEPAPPYVFTTVGRGTYLRVRVPRSVPRSEATAPLVDLAHAVRTALPKRTP